eukprot:NODE_1069_length_2345_cov_0.491541.p2 type:complete len:206 gc:universal NODE_1069_length_2345_cov_0.491541:766-149(-)
MIFTSTLYSIPQTTSVGSYESANGALTVTHGKITCTVSNGQLKCGATGSDFSTLKPKTFNIDFKPISVDFRVSTICMVGTAGNIACGEQKGLIKTDVFIIKEISGSAVEIRMSVLNPFMCVRNKDSNVYCSQVDYSSKQAWTQMTTLTGIDKIRIEGGAICGHQSATADPLSFQCVQIATDFTGKAFKFDPAVGTQAVEANEFKH